MTASQQAKQNAEPRTVDLFFGRMACPACAFADGTGQSESLTKEDHYLACPKCHARYPLIHSGQHNIPWAFPCPGTAHLEWSARYRGEMLRLTEEHNRLNHALSGGSASSRGRRRISLALRAIRDHRRRMEELLAPVALDSDDIAPAVTRNLRDKLPGNQGISSYANNVFRDWSWNNGENEAILRAVESVIVPDVRESLGAILTLGAGAGRLTYDMHRRFAPVLSVALDFNPLLSLLASHVVQGEAVMACEFPLAPIDEAHYAVAQECVAPAAIMDRKLHFVLGDATAPPFAPQSFDTVVTPWLLDILPQDLGTFLPHINRLLPEQGLWINTGTLAFFHADPCRRYSEAEVLELTEEAGFEILSLDHRSLPYLSSPHSGHGRTERVVTFAARKVREVIPGHRRGHLPDWAQDPTLPIPSTTSITLSASSELLKAQVLAAIDGKRSVDAIAVMVAREYGLSHLECRFAIQRMLTDVFEAEQSAFAPW